MLELTDKELEGMGAQAFNLARRDMEQKEFSFLLASYHDGEGLHRMTKIEALINDRLGKDWLNHGQAKDIGFGLIRKAIDLLPPEALVFACVINNFQPTAKFDALSREEQVKFTKRGHDAPHQGVKDGYLTICDALMACVQTAARVCMYKQNMERGRPIGKPEATFLEPAQFGGRMKMYGEQYGDVSKKRKAAQ